MKVKLFYLSYCEHCQKLMSFLKENDFDVTYVDADINFNESTELEELLGTKNYPILEVYIDRELIYFINESVNPSQISEGRFIQPYQTIDNLIYQVEQFIK